MTIPLQFACIYDGQEDFVWSDCLLDLGTMPRSFFSDRLIIVFLSLSPPLPLPQLHNYSTALSDVETALSGNSGDVNSYILAGQATAAMGQFKDAFHHYKAGLQIDPNSKVAYQCCVVKVCRLWMLVCE